MQRGIRASEIVDVCAPIQTPVGRLFVAGNDLAVSAVGRTAAAVEAALRCRFNRSMRRSTTLPDLVAEIVANDGLRGRSSAVRFDLSDLSEFDQEVLHIALTIPRGEVRTYGWIARQLGQPRASKDVGAALGENPIPYLIPCHRIVYSDGRLGGYIFGSRAKRALLLAEGVELAADDDSKVSPRALIASTPPGSATQLALVS
jgi:methylated-DNA-[protein]-cysteine S-methyltransferase